MSEVDKHVQVKINYLVEVVGNYDLVRSVLTLA